jgi:hypothetical protein
MPTNISQVNVADNAKFSTLVNNLGLATWKGRPETSNVVDVMVSPSQLEAWDQAAEALDTQIMHDNLGEAVAAEADFPVYAGMYLTPDPPRPAFIYCIQGANGALPQHQHQLARRASLRRRMPRGLRRTIRLRIICSLSRICRLRTRLIPKCSLLESRLRDGTSLVFISGVVGGRVRRRALFFMGQCVSTCGGMCWIAGRGLTVCPDAREWITTMTVEYAAYQLLTATDADTKASRDKYDYYIIPIVNPDGFAYTQTNERLWRKNRQSTTSASCVGRDINRNWPNQCTCKKLNDTYQYTKLHRGPTRRRKHIALCGRLQRRISR